jgi:hypothetical protein
MRSIVGKAAEGRRRVASVFAGAGRRDEDPAFVLLAADAGLRRVKPSFSASQSVAAHQAQG